MKRSTSSKPLSLVVLAAGIGSRYGGLKQIAPVGPQGETILDFSVYDALQASFNHVVFVINRESEALFRQTVGQRIERQCHTSYAYQDLDQLPQGFSRPAARTKPWGTAHATMMAQPEIRAPFAVINADDYYGRAAFQLVAEHLLAQPTKSERPCYCLVGFRLDNTLSQHGHVSRGICQVDGAGFLTSVVERTRIQRIGDSIAFSEDGGRNWNPLPDQAPVSMNMWGFTPAIFEALQAGFESFLEGSSPEDRLSPEYYLPAAVNGLIQQGLARFKLLPSPDSWYGVTYQQDTVWVKNALSELVRQGEYPPVLWPRT